MAGSSVSWVLCSFVVEGRYCNSYAPVVVPCIDCLAVPVEHISGNLKVADIDVV